MQVFLTKVRPVISKKSGKKFYACSGITPSGEVFDSLVDEELYDASGVTSDHVVDSESLQSVLKRYQPVEVSYGKNSSFLESFEA